MGLDDRSTQNPEGTIAGYHVWAGHISKRIAGPARHEHGGYIYAEVAMVHMRDCRAWRRGQRHGSCTCGAHDAWGAWAEAQGDRDPFASIAGLEDGGHADRIQDLAERILELANEGVDCSASAVELAGWVLTSSVVVDRQERDVRREDAARELTASEGGA